jgi:hypothetical protein
VHLANRHAHVNEDAEGGDAGEQAGDNSDAAEEFRRRRKVGEPPRQAKVADKLLVMRKASENFGIAVGDHNRAEH